MDLVTDLDAVRHDIAANFEMRLKLPALSALVPTTCKLAALMVTEGRDGDSPKVTLVLRELLTNAIEHGCSGDPRQSIDVKVARKGKQNVELVVSDEGRGFSAASLDLSSLDCPAATTQAGLRLANAVCSSMRFENGGRRIVCHLVEEADSAGTGGCPANPSTKEETSL